MYKPHQKSHFALLSWLIIVAGAISLSACNSGGDQNVQNPTTSPTTTETSPAPTETTAASPTTQGGENTNPVNAGLTGGDRPNTDPLELLQSDQVKTELKLTDEQSSKISQISADFRAKINEKVAAANLDKLSPEEKEKKLDEINKELQAEIKTTRTQVDEVLDDPQLKRFKEITLQIYGFGVLNSDNFTEDLKITQEQQDKISGIRDSMLQKMRASWEVPPSDPAEKTKTIEANRKRMEQIIQESNDEALAVLTDEQKKTLETLKGAEFKFTPPSPAS